MFIHDHSTNPSLRLGHHEHQVLALFTPLVEVIVLEDVGNVPFACVPHQKRNVPLSRSVYAIGSHEIENVFGVKLVVFITLQAVDVIVSLQSRWVVCGHAHQDKISLEGI